jgi:hypothetical protein
MDASLDLDASVIVHDLNFVSIALAPNEAQTPLVVPSNANPNAVLSLSAAMQSFQAISGGRCPIAQFRGAVQLPELAPRDVLDRLKAAARLPAVKSLGFRAAERLDQGLDCMLLSV